jgi:hypothetical protein
MGQTQVQHAVSRDLRGALQPCMAIATIFASTGLLRPHLERVIHIDQVNEGFGLGGSDLSPRMGTGAGSAKSRASAMERYSWWSYW